MELSSKSVNLGRSGGAYIPTFKLAELMKEVEDKNSVEYQRLRWDALCKSIKGLVEPFHEDLIRGRGLFFRALMKSQMVSPGFMDMFSALVAVVNTKFPMVGELILNRNLLEMKRAYEPNDKPQLLATAAYRLQKLNKTHSDQYFIIFRSTSTVYSAIPVISKTHVLIVEFRYREHYGNLVMVHVQICPRTLKVYWYMIALNPY